MGDQNAVPMDDPRAVPMDDLTTALRDDPTERHPELGLGEPHLEHGLNEGHPAHEAAGHLHCAYRVRRNWGRVSNDPEAANLRDDFDVQPHAAYLQSLQS